VRHGNEEVDLTPRRIEAAVREIAPVFLNTPQFVDERISREVGREVIVKIETLNPIGSFKGRGTSVLARGLDSSRTWVCATAGNFGQGLAYAARARRTTVDVFAAPVVPRVKVQRMRELGARVEVCDHPEATAREYAAASPDRQLVVDGLAPAMAEGAGTIGLELAPAGKLDTVIVQVGDGALASGVACWLKATAPDTRIIGVCTSGAPAMARSFAAGRAVSFAGEGTIATALAITDPVPASVARVTALVDEIVLVDDDDLRTAMGMIAESLCVLPEPAGAAGVAALLRHHATLPGERVAVILTGAGASE
jgi:threonine dehydratase